MRALTLSEIQFVSGGEDPTQVDDVVVTGVKKPKTPVMVTIPIDTGTGTGSGSGSGSGGTGAVHGPGEVVVQGLCGLAASVKGLDGALLYASDGDGVDELLNILTIAGTVLGVGGVVGLIGKVASGAVNSGAVMGALASVFGDDVALKVSYAAFSAISNVIGATGAGAAGAAAIADALLDGNPPAGCKA